MSVTRSEPPAATAPALAVIPQDDVVSRYEEGEPGGGLFSSLKHRDFRLLWIGVTIAVCGYWVQITAQGWLALQITDSAFYLGLVSASASLPMLFLSPIGGVMADRVNRQLLTMVTRVFIAGLAVVLAVLTGFDLIELWHLVVAALLMGIAWSFDLPTRQALVRDLVPAHDLTNAVALTSTAIQLARIVGPAVGGLLIATLGVAACFYITAIGHVTMAVMLSFISIPPHEAREERRTILADLVSGLRWVVKSEIVLPLMLLALFANMLVGPLQALMPIFARDVLDGGASTLGWMLAATGFGAVFGSMSIAVMSRSTRKGDIAIGGALLSGVIVALFAASTNLPLALFLLILMGAAGAVYSTMTNALVQTLTPRHLQGRVVSIYMLTWNLVPVGALVIGGLAEAFGPQAAVAAGGVTCVLAVAALALARPALRRV